MCKQDILANNKTYIAFDIILLIDRCNLFVKEKRVRKWNSELHYLLYKTTAAQY